MSVLSGDIHVLHVDDDPDFTEMIAEFIQQQDEQFKVETATSYSEGLDRLSEREFDCVVSEFDLPDRNGFEFLEAVRDTFPNLPFIFYTNKESEAIVRKTISASVTDYLRKNPEPSQSLLLVNRIQIAVKAARAERELQETLSRVTDAIYTVNTDWEITYVNEGTETVMGSEEELLGENLWEQFPEAAEGIIWEKFHAAMETQEPKSFEVYFEPLDLWAAANTYPSSTGLTVYFRDISEQKEQEQELERYLDLFEQAQEIASIGAWEYDVEAEEGWWTDEASRIHGFPTDVKPSPEQSFQHYHPEDKPIIREAFQRAIEEGESYDLELRFIDAEGTHKWLHTQGVPYPPDEPVRVRGTIQDITDRKEREQRLHAQRERFESLFTSIQDAIVVADTDRRIIECNPAFTTLFGYSREEIMDEPTAMLYEDPREFEAMGEEIRRQRDDTQFVKTTTYVKKSGQTFTGETLVSYLTDETGEVTGFIGVIRDVSARQEQMQQIQMIDRVLRHNLRNEMTVILGMADLIQDEALGKAVGYSKRIKRTGEELLDIAEKEREVTKILTENPVTVALDGRQLVETSVDTVRERYPDAEIATQLPDEQPVPVTAVEEFHRALEELVENAIKHSDQAVPSVTVTLEYSDEMVRFRIKDDGPGISDMDQQVLIEGKETGRLYHGSGVGLWLVYLYVKHSDGTVTVESNDPRGTTITIRLPTEDTCDT